MRRLVDTAELDVATVFHEDGYLARERLAEWVQDALASKLQSPSKKLS